jgi:hypothetical protein
MFKRLTLSLDLAPTASALSEQGYVGLNTGLPALAYAAPAPVYALPAAVSDWYSDGHPYWSRRDWYAWVVAPWHQNMEKRSHTTTLSTTIPSTGRATGPAALGTTAAPGAAGKAITGTATVGTDGTVDMEADMSRFPRS